MPANRFAPDRIVVGHEQDARILDRILQAILARWPITKCDISSVYSASIDWSDGATVPADNINVQEIFNNTTGIAQALGCMHFRFGMRVDYEDGQTLKITPGHVLHRGQFKTVTCNDDDECDTIATAGLVSVEDCDPSEGNPSGLDSDKWYFVYANMEASGPTPPLSDLIRISESAPVHCPGKGLEHPTENNYYFLGSIRTMDTGVIRPFDRYDNGWVHWHTAGAASDYQAEGYGRNATQTSFTTGGPVRYTEAALSAGAYHDGDKHIPPSADACKVSADERNSGGTIQVKPINEAGAGYAVVEGPENHSQEVTVPVNMCGLGSGDLQTFYIECDNSSAGFDVTGYHEPG